MPLMDSTLGVSYRTSDSTGATFLNSTSGGWLLLPVPVVLRHYRYRTAPLVVVTSSSSTLGSKFLEQQYDTDAQHPWQIDTYH